MGDDMAERINGYGSKGVWQTAGLMLGTGTFLLTAWTVLGTPFIVSIAGDQFEERIDRHNHGPHKELERRVEKVEHWQETLNEKLSKLATKGDIGRLISRISKTPEVDLIFEGE